ncbi:MAG: DUF4127 family protein [Dysosmobacter sp.]|nr:DUF4127 family protein [Dysosmobacter sp.]
MWKKICAAAVLLLAAGALVWLLIPPRQIPSVLESLRTDAGSVDNWENAIAYVPLDDRTDNLEDVVYLAEASGYQVVLPPGDSYCTKLDGQAPNSNGTQYGDRETLLNWLQEMEALGCNLYLLSLDQIFSGGLVNSRSVSGPADLTFADGTVMSETEAFDKFILSLSQDPDNRIYLFDSVVRLASTVGYQGFDLAEYNALRSYGMAARPTLEGNNLTLENIFANYPFAEDGAASAQDKVDPRFQDDLTDQMIENYLGVRMRKLRLTDYVISALKTTPYDNIHLLIGIDDSSNTNNIQYNELHYIAQQTGRGSTLLTGLDSLARLLVGQIAQERYDHQVKTYLRYIGGSQSIPSSEYDFYTLEETVNLHMELFQAQQVPEMEAELQLLVMTAPDNPEKSADYCEELVSQLEHNAQNRIPTILLEASNNAYGDMLEQMLFERVDFGSLLAFAGKYDQANVTGAAFAMGFSRYLYLACRQEKEEACDIAHVRQIANSVALTYPYILHTRYEMNEYVKKLGGNYNNILPNPIKDKLIQGKLEKLFLPRCDGVLNNLRGTRLISSLAPYEEKQINDVVIRDVYFPWNRTFELSFTIDVGPLSPAEN